MNEQTQISSRNYKSIRMKNLEKKYPFFKESNQLQTWNEILNISPTITHLLDIDVFFKFFQEFETNIKQFSDLCLYSKPISYQTPKNNKIYIFETQQYATFKGFAQTSESTTDYVIIKIENESCSKLIHKSKIMEIIPHLNQR